MGLRGPKPKPGKILEMRGSKYARRTRKSPKPKAGVPECPLDLTGESLKTWAMLVPLLEGCGILTKVDRQVLARYCDLWGEYSLLRDRVRATREDLFPTAFKDRERMSMIRLMLSLSTELQRLEQQLGLSPSARSRLETEHGNIGATEPKTKPKDVDSYVNTG